MMAVLGWQQHKHCFSVIDTNWRCQVLLILLRIIQRMSY